MKLYFCIDCNTKISRKSTGRCRKCASQVKSLNTRYERPKCCLCNKQLKKLKSTVKKGMNSLWLQLKKSLVLRKLNG